MKRRVSRSEIFTGNMPLQKNRSKQTKKVPCSKLCLLCLDPNISQTVEISEETPRDANWNAVVGFWNWSVLGSKQRKSDEASSTFKVALLPLIPNHPNLQATKFDLGWPGVCFTCNLPVPQHMLDICAENKIPFHFDFTVSQVSLLCQLWSAGFCYWPLAWMSLVRGLNLRHLSN